MKICVTGHRPNKLYGYDLQNIQWLHLKEKLKTILLQNQCDKAITGMALGVDTIFALAVLDLQATGYPIKLHCAIPCQNQSAKWNQESRDLYKKILSQANSFTLVSDMPYQPYLMQKRNQYMVDLADKVIAVWDGSKGGTYNCVAYANKKHKPIIRITP